MYYYEVWECVRKLFLTGLLVYFEEGTSTQVCATRVHRRLACLAHGFALVAYVMYRDTSDRGKSEYTAKRQSSFSWISGTPTVYKGCGRTLKASSGESQKNGSDTARAQRTAHLVLGFSLVARRHATILGPFLSKTVAIISPALKCNRRP